MKRLLTLFLCAICAMSAWAEITPSQPAAGTGTPSDPYQITNREELYWFVAETNNDKTVCAKLIADIVVNEGTFDSDGKWSKPGTPESWKPMAVYGGIFDGNGHVISGLYNNDRDAVLNVGFCSGLSNGTIKNLGIINTYFNAGKYYSGIIAPNVTSGIITNCYTAASTIIGTQYAGGIIAANIGCTISNCYSTSTGNSSKGQNYYGGISGINRSGEIVNCYTNQQVNRGGGVHKDDSDFKSGEVTYLLNEGKNDGTQVWFQDLSEGGDDYPTFVNTGSNAVQLSSDGKSYVNNIAHTHTLTKVDAVAATSTEHGHNEYWVCSGCGNWFADETGTTLTTIEELVTHYVEYVNGMGTCQVCNSFRYEVPPTDMQGTYLIGNTGQLIAFANMVNNGQDFRAANAKLISDIILNEGSFGTDGTFIAKGSSEPSTPFSWPIIGAGTHTGNGYKGTFDGQGHTVSGLYVYANPTGLASFVGILEANGKIMNLGVINSYFEGSRVGGICGYTDGKSEIINCYSDIIGKGDYIGGIVGQGFECKGISNCYSTSDLTCTVDFLSAGGIVGEKNSTFLITNCYTTCSTILGSTLNSFESACEAGVSVERFASGEIAYKLNGSTSEGNFVWYQKIGEDGDAYPSLTKAKDNTVYYVPGYLCDGVTADGEMYYNNNGERYVADHTEATDAAVAATCTETGLTEGKHCSICYTVLVEQVETEPLGHSWGEYHFDGDQTCTNDGHKTAECTREGCSEKNKIVATGAALGHSWGEYVLDGDQTCTNDGHKTAECTREGCSEENKIVATGTALGHDWEDFFTVDAWEDCEHAGSKSIHCHRQGCDAHQNETVIPALGHLFTEYLSNGDVTTEADGHKTAECDRGCGATHTVIDEGSRIRYLCSIGIHNFSEEIVSEDTKKSDAICTEKAKYYKSCSGCGALSTSDVFEVGESLGHSWGEYHLDGDQTCTNDGHKTAECTREGCSEKNKIVATGAALGHDYTSETATAPYLKSKATCIADAVYFHKCSRCESRGATIWTKAGSALGHEWGEYDLDGDQTCTNDGHKTAECTREGCTVTNTIEATGAALGHDYTSETATAPYLKSKATCIADAVYFHKCSHCESRGATTWIKEGSALGHSWGEYHLDGDQTCTYDGHKKAECTREGCSEENKIGATGAALGHDWEDYFTTDIAATCTEAGSESRHCARCSATTDVAPIVAHGHSFTDYISNGDATTEADGTKTAVCDHGCGETDTVIDEGSRIVETPTGISDVKEYKHNHIKKYIENGVIVIEKDGVKYRVEGKVIK